MNKTLDAAKDIFNIGDEVEWTTSFFDGRITEFEKHVGCIVKVNKKTVWVKTLNGNVVNVRKSGWLVSKEPQYNLDMIKTFDASKIFWINNNGRVDASELGLKAGEVPYTAWTCPVGARVEEGLLKLVNKEKGTECVFQLRDSNNYGWRFESLDRKILLDVFND